MGRDSLRGNMISRVCGIRDIDMNTIIAAKQYTAMHNINEILVKTQFMKVIFDADRTFISIISISSHRNISKRIVYHSQRRIS